jgi:hypothetical protein
VQGNVYTANTINISQPPAPVSKDERNLLHQWQLWVGLAVALLTLVTLLLDLPQKWRELGSARSQPEESSPMITQPLAGQALDETTNHHSGCPVVPDYDMTKPPNQTAISDFRSHKT